jgi:hypothetical protein
MPKGSALSEQSSGENISHFTAVRMRVNGVGSLQLKVYSMDDIRSQVLLPLTLAETTNRQPTRLCNFVEQRAAFEGKTTEIDEWFKINRLIIYSNELWTSFPG